MTDELKFRRAADQAEKLEVAGLLESMRLATMQYLLDAPDPREAASKVMTACSIFAGVQFANLLLAGEVDQRDTARTVKAMASNFREGIKGGLAIAERAHKEMAS
ncbi:hypothetical protein [Novosphingobium sp. FKTRR1]|uniref:hypothetical protein n=1 Tax=Novosphingobium sp. FKTRR1 TaxID=2879118 RepID=UPI001CF0A821|nr:hypothetical protein [Novosphingobium sp. FKTRR1]